MFLRTYNNNHNNKNNPNKNNHNDNNNNHNINNNNHKTNINNYNNNFETLLQSLKSSTKTYFNETSVHGFVYLNKENSTLKKCLWFLMCILGVAFCFQLAFTLISRFNMNYTEINLASSAYPVWHDPFPGVSICNYNIVYKNHTGKAIKILEAAGFGKDQISNFLTNLNRLIMCNNCNNSINENFDVLTYEKIHEALDKAGYDLNSMMKDLAQPCPNMLKKCFWKSKQVPCMDIFKFVKTSNGYCCSFNYYGSKDVQAGDAEEDKRRLYAGAQGINYGLQVFLDPERRQYYSSIKTMHGFDVLIRNGNDFANMRLISKTLVAGQELSVGLYSTTTRSDPDVKYLNPEKRGCLFKDEGNLRWTKLYTFQNCLSECRTLGILHYCKCIPYVFPVNDSSIRVCTLVDMPCLRQNELKYSSMVVMSEVDQNIISKIDRRVGLASKCHCLPDCDEVKYNFFIDRHEAPGSYKGNVSILNVFYNSISSTMSARSVSVPWDIFVASIGGVFGLCLGGSVMSLLELIYHIFNGYIVDKFRCKLNFKN